MKSIVFIGLSLFGLSAFAQPVVLESQFFCKTDSFSSREGKVKAAELKKCSSLVEGAESPVKNGQECKNRAVEKGEACLKRIKGDQVSVTVKLTEKFGQNANFNSFTCEVDRGGNTACP